MTPLPSIKDFFGFDAYRRREVRDRMNLLGAAEAHILWKTRLGQHIQGSLREPLETSLIGQDNLCQLGHWIRGSEFEPFRGLPEFERLGDAHHRFHRFGDSIIEKLRSGDREGAEMLFRGPYNHALRQIIQALTEINRHFEEA